MIYRYFKISDADESVLDLNDHWKIELKNDNVQSFNRDEEAARRGKSGDVKYNL